MSLTMKMLKTEIDQLATLMINVFERIEKIEKVGDITSHMVPIQAPVVPVETVEGLENHVPRALLKKMVEVFEANSPASPSRARRRTTRSRPASRRASA